MFLPDLKLNEDRNAYLDEAVTVDHGQNPDREAYVTLEKDRIARINTGEGFFFWVKIVFCGLAVLLFIVVLAIYLWHIVGPECYRWLNAPDIDRIERFCMTILSGIAGTTAITYFFKH